MIELTKAAVSQMKGYVARKSVSTAWWVLVFFLTNFAICTALLIYVVLAGTPEQLKSMADIHVKELLGLLGAFGTYAAAGLVNKKIENGNRVRES